MKKAVIIMLMLASIVLSIFLASCDSDGGAFEGVKLESSILNISGENLSATVSNSTETFSFLNDIKVAEGASYILASDIGCQNTIVSKTVALEEGDNTYYLLVTNGEEQKLYTVTIRRRPIYTVEFNTNGGTKVETLYVEEDSTIEIQQTSKTGYTFDAWTIDGEQIEFPYQVKNNETIVAKWNPISYTIKYNLNDGTNNAENVSNYTIEQTVALKNPTRDYYRFDGWYESENLEGASVSKIARGTTGNKTFYAKWTPVQYEIKYELNGGTNNENNVFTYNTEQEISVSNPTRDGYAFLGWFTNENFEGSAIEKIALGSGENKKFYAKWQACENKLVFNGNGSTSGSMVDMAIDTDETVSLENNKFEKLGYTFKGWSTTADGSVEFADGASYTMGTSSTYALYAVWEVNNNTLVLDANGGIGSMSDIIIATDANINLPSNAFTRYGYTFKGWSTTADGSVELVDGSNYTMGTNSTYTLYAVWEIITYEIRYSISNHNNPTTYTVLDLPINLKNPTINENEKFLGWYSTSDFDDSSITQITEIGGADIYAGLLSTEGLEFFDEGETITVKSYFGTTGLVFIPEKINGKSVTKIDSKAFENSETLKIIDIPKTIEYMYFKNCTALVNVNIDSNNTTYKSIDGNVYSADGETFVCYAIGKKCKEFTIPYGVKTINDAFSYSLYIEKIIVSDSVKRINSGAFAFCVALKEVIIGSGVNEIDCFAFYKSTALENVVILGSNMWKAGVNLAGPEVYGSYKLTAENLKNSNNQYLAYWR